MPTELPSANYKEGWPESLTDINSEYYVILRDGVPTGDYAGHSCLYGKVGDNGFIHRKSFYMPALAITPDNILMNSAGPWMDNEEFARLRLPGITIPPEPVEIPEEEEGEEEGPQS